MATTFSFGFDSEDIEDDATSDADMPDADSNVTSKGQPELAPARLHTLDEMLATLPSAISYNTHILSSDPPWRLPRRDLHDIRAQLQASADVNGDNAFAVIDNLTSDDILPRLYEGGFKTWECSKDLAKFISTDPGVVGEDYDAVIELGAGTALPSCAWLQSLLRKNPPGSTVDPGSIIQRTLVLADYNEHVLTHASIPNLLLAFSHARRLAVGDHELDIALQDDIDVSTEVLDEIRSWMTSIKLRIVGISGAWSSDFDSLLSQQLDANRLLIMASETIYQPDSLQAFTATLLHTAARAKHSTALIAAKKVYFGVGGGIDEFEARLAARNVKAETIWDSGGSGVGRVILQIRS